jgi:hypothetical protein
VELDLDGRLHVLNEHELFSASHEGVSGDALGLGIDRCCDATVQMLLPGDQVAAVAVWRHVPGQLRLGSSGPLWLQIERLAGAGAAKS